MPGLDDWLSVARLADPDELREQILSGYKGGKPFTPYVPTITLPSPVNRVLDFGCGLGRNFPYLKTVSRHISGFDLPPMIERCRALAGESVDLLLDDWTEARRQRFDLIFAALVLQHIEPPAQVSYVTDFARMTPAVYLLTRAQDDFGTNVLNTIVETGLFVAGQCTRVDHDPATHQLKTLGTRDCDAVRHDTDGAHYEVLLRSKVFAARL